ncbi:hypothetical protein O0L34_g16497 [Tuta absoluta]|nr:hypothetical protein O0L34_g16497 [Tuta absoluta]
MKLQGLQYLFRDTLLLMALKNNCYKRRYKRGGYLTPRHLQGGNETDPTALYFLCGLALGIGCTHYLKVNYPCEVKKFKQNRFQALRTLSKKTMCPAPEVDPCDSRTSLHKKIKNKEPSNIFIPGTCVELLVDNEEPSNDSECGAVEVSIEYKESNNICEGDAELDDDDGACQPNKSYQTDEHSLQISIEDNGSEKVYDIIFVEEEDDICRD